VSEPKRAPLVNIQHSTFNIEHARDDKATRWNIEMIFAALCRDAAADSFLKQRLRELFGVEGLQVVRLLAEVSPINLSPVADSHNDDLQNFVVDFVNYPVVAHADAPRIAVRKFFAAGWAGVCFQFGQFGKNAGFNFAGNAFHLFSRGTGENDAIVHFRFAARAFL
jgi:hypothetical protein